MEDLAKFAAGLVAADFLATLWFASAGLFPVEFFGHVITEDIVVPTLVFDAALFLVLVHYGWNVGKIPALRERSYLMLAGLVFGAVAVFHLYRIFTGTDLTIGEWMAPVWLSWFGVAVTTYLSYMSFRLAGRMKR